MPHSRQLYLFFWIYYYYYYYYFIINCFEFNAQLCLLRLVYNEWQTFAQLPLLDFLSSRFSFADICKHISNVFLMVWHNLSCIAQRSYISKHTSDITHRTHQEHVYLTVFHFPQSTHNPQTSFTTNSTNDELVCDGSKCDTQISNWLRTWTKVNTSDSWCKASFEIQFKYLHG